MNITIKMVAVVSVSLAVLGAISGSVLLRSWEQENLNAMTEQVEVFAQDLLEEIARVESQNADGAFDLSAVSSMLSAACQRLFARPISSKLGITHIFVLKLDKTIAADARPEKVGTQIDDAAIRENIGWRKIVTVRSNEMIHTLFPLISANGGDIGTLTISVSEMKLQAMRSRALRRIAKTLTTMLACLAFVIAPLFHRLITTPLRYVSDVAHSMIEGRFLHSNYLAKHHDEFGQLAKTLVELSVYFEEMTLLAQQISTGSLSGQQVQKRSKRDVLGVALQEMLAYLRAVADGATRIAEGDVRIVIPLRTDTDALGRALHQMIAYLNDMADTATQIATGDLRSEVAPRSERDVLGTAFANMSAYLHALANSATAIAEGNLAHHVQPQSPDDILGNAFHRMANQLRENFDHIQQEMAERIRAQEALQRLNEELETRVEQRTAEIARQKYILDMFMANVPDAIYFKDREGRITQTNRAHADIVGHCEPVELIGKSDFDFFPEHQARLKYEHEQEILRTGQPILAYEEPDLNGRWALTTKMPLRDEHGEIIGTFGISHDITPLKLAQQQVEEAYAEIQMLNEQLHQENLRMGAELDVARRLQQMVLPAPEELRCLPGVEIVGYMQPAEEVGGDYYDVLPCARNGQICLGIGDVTGHGLESGMIMLMTQTAIRALIDRGDTNSAAFFATLNRVLYQNIQRMGVERSLTLTVAHYADGELRLSGQHEEALVVRANGVIERIDTFHLGFPLGLVDDIQQWVAETAVRLHPGDGLVLYTDGITEAENAASDFYGLDRLCAVISANWQDASAEAVKTAIIEDLRQFVGSATVYDDVTLVVLKQHAEQSDTLKVSDCFS